MKEKVEVKDPLTGKRQLVVVERSGHTEKKLIQVLADKKTTRDQKDHALSMYLFERGAHNISMIVDLFRYKGQHSKQTQVFQSRMRLDFETFVNSFVKYLHNQARLIGITLCRDIDKEKKEFEKWLKVGDNKGRGYTYKDYNMTDNKDRVVLIEMAIYALDEADNLLKGIEDLTKARMAMKGGGIYVDKSGKTFSVNDPELDEIIKREREIEKETEKENDK